MLYNIFHGISVRPSDPMCLASGHILISKQDSTIRALRYNRCVTGMRSRDENHAVRFTQNAENRSRSRDTQPTRGVSDELARGCKRWHPLAPERRYGKKKSSLWVYVPPPISHTPQKHQHFREQSVRGIYFYKQVCLFVHWSSFDCLIMFPLIFVFVLWLYNNNQQTNLQTE